MSNGVSGAAGLGGMVSFNWGECKNCFSPSKPAFWATSIFLLALGYLIFLHWRLVRI